MSEGKSVTDYRVAEAARWLAGLAPEEKPHPVIPELRRRFALSARDACLAAAEAATVRQTADDLGEA